MFCLQKKEGWSEGNINYDAVRTTPTKQYQITLIPLHVLSDYVCFKSSCKPLEL